MDAERWNRVKELYLAALSLDFEERAAFLEKACGGDDALREEVDKLIAFESEGDRLFASSPALPDDAASGKTDHSKLGGDGIRTTRSSIKESLREFIRKYPELDDEIRELIESSRTIGDFRIKRVIGRGGMGTVFEAQQLSLNRRVALKVLPSHLSYSEESILKFRREAEAGGRQTHPGIVAIYAVGEHEGIHYIAQEYVEGGETLSDRLNKIRKDGVQPPGYFRAAAKFISRVADSLQHAHDSGVFHRDIKPSNILLTREGRPKVTDFGLAKVEDALALSRTGELAGTPYYMSPEQAMSIKSGIDKRTDIYSLGVTLYELLTLRRPFEGKTSHEVLKKIMLFEPAEPLKVNSRVARDLSVICLKAMEKDPDHRYQTMQDFADDLRRFTSGEVIHAKPAGLWIRTTKRIKRNPAKSTAVGLGVLALILSVVVLPWIIVKLEREKLAAVEQERAEKELEADKAIAIKEFFIKIMATGNPFTRGERRHGIGYTVVEALEEASQLIDSEFADQPLIKASIQQSMGTTYFALGSLTPAREHLTAAFETMKKNLGESDPETLAAMSRLACVLSELGDDDKAEKMLQFVIDELGAEPGGDQGETLLAMINLALLKGRRGDFDESEKIYRKVLEIGDASPDVDKRLMASTKGRLGTLLTSMARFEEAENMFNEAYPDEEDVLFGERTTSIIPKIAMGCKYSREGRFDMAEKIFSENLDSLIEFLGEKHSYTLAAKCSLAAALTNLDRLQEAKPMFLETIRFLKERQPTETPQLFHAQRELARFHYKKGELQEAEALLVPVCKKQKEMLDEENVETLLSMQLMAGLRTKQERYEEAETLYLRVLELQLTHLGENYPDTLNTEYDFAYMLMRWNHGEEAEDRIRKALPRMRNSLGNDHRTTLRAMALLGILCTEKENWVEAEGLFRESAEGMQAALGPDHSDTLTTWFNLGATLINQESYDKAEPVMQMTMQARIKKLGERDPKTLDTMRYLAYCRFMLERYSEAEPLFRRVLKVIEEDPGGSDTNSIAELKLYHRKCLNALERLDAGEGPGEEHGDNR